MTTVLATAADERYGYWLLNMIASEFVPFWRVTILRKLDDPLAQIAERGYFAVSNGPRRISVAALTR